ncbi:MmgE/PrpD family protein [Methylobacterium indicum]|uniref:MmgE/PrpD family protein n=1 Tax=Methylobacterium indicum TaxID=1775910 RepID=A0ABR5HJF1_9HYPH|nr:MmgE/PrpD family protein [Methylobacterium indicum]KMO15295.1 MmgE/PrpD family protein [Methylobacterium indicum]KMO26897.1 MmgE/PrpD family protein [Methylobacterium indicum]
MTPAGRILGDYLGHFASRTLEPDVREKALMCLVDTLGLSLSARDEPTARAAIALSRPLAPHSDGAARAWASGVGLAPSEAAFANGVAAHAHFQDDTDHESWTHPGSLVPPAVVALAERDGASLEVALRALVAGYSTINWLGRDEVVARRLIARGFRTSPTLGTIAAAAGAAVVLNLDPERAASAVSIAASTTGGTLEPVRAGADEWRVQNGRAAQGGLIAACLAASGVAGAPEALDGPKGFLATVAGMEQAPDVWSTPPDPAAMRGIMCKPYATLGDNMPAAMAAQKLHGEGLDPAAVEAIEVTLWEPYTVYPGTNFKGPYERLVQTQASTAFAVSAMLSCGDITYEMGTSLRDDPVILDLVRRTTVVPDAEGGALDSRITLRMKDGSRREAHSSQMPRDLIFLTRDRTLAVFDQRLTRLGAAPGAARALGERLFDGLDGARSLPLRTVLDDILALAR